MRCTLTIQKVPRSAAAAAGSMSRGVTVGDEPGTDATTLKLPTE